MQKNEKGRAVRCSFCGKVQDDVERIIAGPGVYICDECVKVCSNIIENDLYEDSELSYETEGVAELPKPEEIKKILDEYVIGQEDAKKHWQLQYTIIIKELIVRKIYQKKMM